MRMIFHRGKIAIGWGLTQTGELVTATQRKAHPDTYEFNVEDTSAAEITEQWLEQTNSRFSREAMPYHQRPFHALLAWTELHNCSVVFGSKLYERVQQWFHRLSPPEAHLIGPAFRGAFYYDAYFWKVDVPIMYGTVNLNPWDCLKGLPDTLRVRLKSDRDGALQYLAVWADCMDYGLGRDDIFQTLSASFGKDLFISANDQLEATVSLLFERPPNPRAAESARMATEIFLKSFIALHRGLAEDGARKIGHDVKAALCQCLHVQPSSEIRKLEGLLDLLPPIDSRYKVMQYHPGQLWDAYAVAQFAGSAVTRSLTDRNARQTLEEQLGAAPQDKTGAVPA